MVDWLIDLGQAQRRDGPAAGAALGISVLQGARRAEISPGAGLFDGLHRLRSPAYTAGGACKGTQTNTTHRERYMIVLDFWLVLHAGGKDKFRVTSPR